MKNKKIYTKYELTKLENCIDKEMNLIKCAFINYMQESLVSVWLVGGYGRGEGGVSAHKNIVKPKNNYDVLIVYKDYSKVELELIKRSILKALDGKLSVRLEMSFIHISKTKNVPNIMIYKDIYEMGHCLYGEPPQSILPSQVNYDLPLVEALKIIRNRGMLWVALRDRVSHLGYICDYKQRQHWLNKVIIGYIDALLIVNKSYKVSYCEKVQSLKSLVKDERLQNSNIDIEFLLILARNSLVSRFYDIDYEFEDRLYKVEKLLFNIHNYVKNKALLTDDSTKVFREYTGIFGLIKSVVRSIQAFGLRAAFLNCFKHPVDVLNEFTGYVFYKNIQSNLTKKFNSPFWPKQKITIKELSNDLMKIYMQHLV
jgi:hypothetical protein